MAWELARMIGSKAKWLADFSKGRERRPEWNIRQIEEQKAVLEQAQSDYRRAAERDASKENAAHGAN